MAKIKLKLSEKDRARLQEFKKAGRHSQRVFNRATILLFLDKGLLSSEIERLLEVDRSTIWRTRKRYLESGLEAAVAEAPRSGQPKKYTTCHEAQLIALACSPAPKGRRRWTIRLLAMELNKKKEFESITYGSVRNLLKKTSLSRG
jgi:putative transposase